MRSVAVIHDPPLEPSHYGQRLIPTLVDDIAQSDPERVYVSIARSTDLQDGFRDISYRVFAQAVDRCSWLIERELARSPSFETITYIGPVNLLYQIIVLAAAKTGHKALVVSPRNSITAHLSLLDTTRCKTVLVPQAEPPIVQTLLRNRPMRKVLIPDLDHFLEPTEEIVPSYAYLKKFSQARHEPFLVSHTSGSTGIPKAVVMTHGTFACMDAYQLIPSLGGRAVLADNWRGVRYLMGFPLFHTGGNLFLLGLNVFYGMIAVLPPPPLTATAIDFIHSHGNIEASILPPSLLVDVFEKPAYRENLCHLRFIGYGGGPLPKDIGDKVSRITKLVTIFGSTEAAFYPMEFDERQDWDYVRISSFLGHEYQPYDDNDLYELVIRRNANLDLFQGVFSTFPKLDEYATRDLYSEHPTKPNYWVFRGRSDDILAFSNAEKLNPVDMESTISAHPAVVSAIVVGHGRSQASLLIEPKTTPTTSAEREQLLDDVWSAIERANQECPAHGRVLREFVIFTSPEKAMLRTAKGNVRRAVSIDMYAEELDLLYAKATAPDSLNKKDVDFEVSGKETLRDYLERLVAAKTKLDRVNYDANFFELGLDSLHVVALTKQINAFVASYRQDLSIISNETVYAHPTVNELESALEISKQTDTATADIVNRLQRMQNLFLHYSSDLPQGLVVVLTGSTGSLGAYLLERLILDPSVSKIYCLNRRTEAESYQKESHVDKGLSINFNKVEFLQCGLGQPSLGLAPSAYDMLLKTTTHVLHNAWDVNFNLPVEAFAETHISGVRQFIDLSRRSAKRPTIFFVSTVGTVRNWKKNHNGHVPEDSFEDWTTAEERGYAESKLIAERLLTQATKEGSISSTICRIGQIAGPTSLQGMWSKQSWFASLVASSIKMGKLPTSLGPLETVDWIPIDMVARSVIELLNGPSREEIMGPTDVTIMNEHLTEGLESPFANVRFTETAHERPVGRVGKTARDQSTPDYNTSPAVYHLVNPRPTTWSDLLPTVHFCAPGLEVISFSDWVDELRHAAWHSEDLTKVPAVKLIGYFEELQKQMMSGFEPPVLETFKATQHSATMAALEPVNAVWMENWMRQWSF